MNRELVSIRTERCLIRVVGKKDGEALCSFAVANRERLAPWEPLRDERYYTLAAASERAEKARASYERGAAVPLVAWDLARSAVVAQCSFTNIVRGSFQACHLGFSVDGEYEGAGIMYEVASAAVEHMFHKEGLHRIMANYMPANHRSARLLARLGFVREGYARSYLKIAGRWEDHILTSRINPA